MRAVQLGSDDADDDGDRNGERAEYGDRQRDTIGDAPRRSNRHLYTDADPLSQVPFADKVALCQRIDAAALAELQVNLAAQEQADPVAFDGLDDDLHRALCAASGHPAAWTLAHRANGQLDRIRRLSLPEPGYVAEMVSEHHDVVAAVAAGDSDGAERALRHHLRMVPSLLGALRERHPDYFEEEDE